MPRRKISQREAHENRKRLAVLARFANDTTCPAPGDPDNRGALLVVTDLSEYAKGILEGARIAGAPHLALIARREGGELRIYAYRVPR